MKIRSILYLLFISVFAFGQKVPSDYFKEANRFYDEGQMDKALDGYMYIVENHPRNELYPRALYNVGHVYFLQKEYKKSINAFNRILQGGQDEREPSGGGIMSDPYANYRHRAALQISDCYYELRQYDSALYYLALSDTVYPYLADCGNAYAENDIRTALRYSDIYQKLGQPDKAIEKLLPQVFNTELVSNSKIIAELKSLLAGKRKLLVKLDEAIDGVYSKTYSAGRGTYERYCIRWLGVEICFSNHFYGSRYTKENVITWMRESEFYQMVARLGRK
jgi:Uncharacterized protein conserved in bacteria